LQPSQEQNGEEKGTTAGECAYGVVRLTVEKRSHNQVVGDNDEELGVQNSSVTKGEPEFTLGACKNLADE
jgi:hypothetical protein